MKYNLNLPTYVNVLINTLRILNLIINLKPIITSDYRLRWPIKYHVWHIIIRNFYEVMKPRTLEVLVSLIGQWGEHNFLQYRLDSSVANGCFVLLHNNIKQLILNLRNIKQLTSYSYEHSILCE